MRKKILYLIAACLLVFTLVLWMDWHKTNSWHDFFVAPAHEEGKLLHKAGLLDRTEEINQKIKGKTYYKEQKLHFFLEDMVTHIQADLAKRDTFIAETLPVIQEPIVHHPAPIQAAKPVAKVIKHKPKKVTPQEKEVEFFPVAYQNKKRKVPATHHNHHFITGYVAGKQTLRHGRSIKIAVQESFVFQGKKIPKGAFLYGVVAFGKERILSQLETAVFGRNTMAVQIALYDSDYTLGLLAEDLLPFMEHAKDRLLHKAVGSSRNNWLQALGSTTVDAIQSIKKDTKVTLENKRKVWLKPIEK